EALLAQLQRRLMFSADDIKYPQVVQDQEMFWRLAELLAQLTGTRVGLADFRVSVALGRHQCWSLGGQQVELALGALWGVWERGEQFEATLRMGNGFHISGALERPRAGLLPVAHGLGMAPGFGVVVGQELGLGGDGLWKPGFEELRNLLVVLLSSAFQQGGI